MGNFFLDLCKVVSLVIVWESRLHLTHELVNVHKGSIEYAENEGQGSVFTVTLPLDSSVYESKDFLISTALMEETDLLQTKAFRAVS